MKKLLIFILLSTFGINLLGIHEGCSVYCTSVKSCCVQEEELSPFLPIKDCDKEFNECVDRYRHTPSDECPQPIMCD